jgi:hypothetical protein
MAQNKQQAASKPEAASKPAIRSAMLGAAAFSVPVGPATLDVYHGEDPARLSLATKTASMFHDYTDLSGVETSWNAHPEQEYEHRGRMSAATESEGARSQVLLNSGTRRGSMTFNSTLRPSRRGDQ